MEQLQGRNALLTGAAGGLGRYIATALAAEGVDLALSDLPGASVEPLIEELRGLGVRAEAMPADLSHPEAVEGLAAAAEAIGPIDILVNNAGLEFAGPFTEATRAEVEAIVSVNLIALIELTRAVLPGMLERRRGHVVNLASLAGKLPSPYLVTYSATKHAVVGFSHSLRAELGAEPVGVSAVCPGFISEVGMYGRLEPAIGDPPRELGKLPPGRVGAAVVEAIRENRPELIVNQRPIRPLAALASLAPGLTIRLLRSERNLGFARAFADARTRRRLTH